MAFQRARTNNQIQKRQNDILNACSKVFDNHGYDEITLKMISDETAISRTTMYTYYKTKEDIFLDLIEREYLTWYDTLLNQFHDQMDRVTFCKILATTLLSQKQFLRLLSIQNTIIEQNSDPAHLVDFKKRTAVIFDAFEQGLTTTFPQSNKSDRDCFIVHFSIYSLGFYPYMHPNQKQIQSLQQADVQVPEINDEQLLYDGIFRLTSSLAK